MAKRISRYYLYQVAGWGLLLLGLGSLELFLSGGHRWGRLAITMAAGLIATHLLRMVIVRYRWMRLPFKQVLWRILFGVIPASALAGAIMEVSNDFLGGTTFTFSRFLRVSLVDYPILFIPWAGFYVFYFYIEKSRREGSKNRQLALRLEVMKKQSETSETNIEALMNSLEHISTLIGEDPDKSREEITAFSNLLRKGFI